MIQTNKLETLEGMRAFAALWVLVLHAELATKHFIGDMGTIPLLSNGYLGVNFFFILSGFIIAHSVTRLPVTRAGLARYTQARLLRVYIPYLPVGIVIYLLYATFPDLSQSPREISALTSFTLLPDSAPPALSVAWTLVHEMIFYLIFGLWFVSKRLLGGVIILWGLTIIGVHLQGQVLGRFWSYGLSPLNLCFLLGVGIAQVKASLPQGRGWVMVVAVLGAGLVIWQAAQTEPSQILVSIGFGLIIVAAASPYLAAQRLPRWITTLGAASYAIYLVHDPVLSVVVRLLGRAAPQIGIWPGFILISFAALTAGVLYWWIYERHALKAARNLIMSRP